MLYVEFIIVVFGNGGIVGLFKVINIIVVKFNDYFGFVEFVKKNNINFVVFGLEVFFVDGIEGYFCEVGIFVFGFFREVVCMEGSKIFFKDFMKKYNILIVVYENFFDYEKVSEYLKIVKYNVVIKVIGLVVGKGVIFF